MGQQAGRIPPVTILVERSCQLVAFSDLLSDWPVIIDEKKNLPSLGGSFRSRVRRLRTPWVGQQ